MKRIIEALLIAGCLVVAGCHSMYTTTTLAQPACQEGTAMQQTQLWFGLSQPDGQLLSAQQWQSFVDQVITPAFPQGLSVMEAKGQWLGNNGVRVSENSRGVLLIYPPSTEKSQAINQIRTRYRQLFAQESVMRVDQPVCVAF